MLVVSVVEKELRRYATTMVEICFKGNNVELDEKKLFFPPLDYWVEIDEKEGLVSFGLTLTGSIKEGGYRSLEFAVEEGDTVAFGDIIAVAVTGKIKYLESIASGRVAAINSELESSPELLEKAAVNPLWLMQISTFSLDEARSALVDLSRYREILGEIEAGGLPPGVKGPGSPTCRSVYEAIQRSQDK